MNIREPRQVSIAEINEKDLNKKVKVWGQVTGIKFYEEEEFQIITLDDNTKKIAVIISNGQNLQKTLSEQKQIIVIGTISHYKDTLQIEAEKIVLLK
ncbi:MAG: hypothetical protein RL557_839 [archaeon]